MKRTLALLAMTMTLPAVAFAQRSDRGHDNASRSRGDQSSDNRGRGRGNNQRETPQRGQGWGRGSDRDHREAVPARPDRDDRYGYRGDRDRDRWYAGRPYAYGRFVWVGPRYVWRMHGGSALHFNINGAWFSVAPFDYDYAGGWLWDYDDIIINDDPGHIGWYIAYNVRLGTSVHVQYLGGQAPY